MRKLSVATILVSCSLFFLFQGVARAQQIDLYYGGSTIEAPGATAATGSHAPYSLRGGYYNTIGGDVLFFHHLGAGAEVSWKGSQGDYAGQPTAPFRPVFFDFNAVFAPSLSHRVQPEFQAGIGAEDIRYYTGFYNYFTGTNYVTSKHFMGHFSVGLKLYAWGNFFIRPEADFYLVRNNVDFSSDRANRYGVSIGYTLGSH